MRVLNGLTQIETYLEGRNKMMGLVIMNPHIKMYRDGIKNTGLPVLRCGYISTQEELAQMKRVNELLAEYNELVVKLDKVKKAAELIGKRVWKYSKKPFAGGDKINVVRGIIIHPYKPGWNLAYTFQNDGSCVHVDQVREFRGN